MVADRRPVTVEPAQTRPEQVELTILMPCLDEAETLGRCIDKARRYLETSGISGEVLIADNGSTDGSIQIATEHGARVVHVQRKGYGAALAGGIEAARGRLVIMGDADDSYDFSDLSAFVEALRDGADLVMGNRFRGGIKAGAMPPLHKYLGTPVISRLGRLFFGARIGDFNCGMRGFSRQSALRMDLRSTGMEFASEMIIKAALLEMRCDEVPTTLSPDGRTRRPHLRTWRDGWRHLRFMLLYSPRWLFLYPGLVLLAAGLGVGGWLLGGPRMVGSVRLDVHTLLIASAAVLVGFQSVLFAAFTETFARAEGLAPRAYRVDRLARLIPLEAGIVIGTVLALAGLGLVIAAAAAWGSAGFGDLDYQKTMRWVIPGVTLGALGVEAVLGSFFLGILSVRRR